jgi:hypothetical protein
MEQSSLCSSWKASQTIMIGDQPSHIDCLPGGAPPAGGTPPPNRDCVLDGGPRQKPSPGTPSAQDNQQHTCITGTIQQLNGTTLTVKDLLQAKAYTIALTQTTRLTQDTLVPATTLKPNTRITVVGPSNNGVIAAFAIIIHNPSATTE